MLIARLFKQGGDKAADFRQRDMTIFLSQGVVIEPRQNMFFFIRGVKPRIELILRLAVHYVVTAGDKQLSRYRNGGSIRHQAVSGFVEFQQDINGNRPGDQRIPLK